ncbi:MAG: DUF6152 family protein [Geminicoccaceae bacterium]
MKRIFTAIAALTLIHLGLAGAALGHHGWSWTTGDNIELIGIIREASLGMPHGTLKVDAEGDVWTVQVGQPWRNERAGLRDGDLAEGVEITIIGEPSAEIEDRVMKAERLYLDGNEYVLYPDRD